MIHCVTNPVMQRFVATTVWSQLNKASTRGGKSMKAKVFSSVMFAAILMVTIMAVNIHPRVAFAEEQCPPERVEYASWANLDFKVEVWPSGKKTEDKVLQETAFAAARDAGWKTYDSTSRTLRVVELGNSRWRATAMMYGNSPDTTEGSVALTKGEEQMDEFLEKIFKELRKKAITGCKPPTPNKPAK